MPALMTDKSTILYCSIVLSSDFFHILILIIEINLKDIILIFESKPRVWDDDSDVITLALSNSAENGRLMTGKSRCFSAHRWRLNGSNFQG